jgi:YhzD-like protein
MNTYALTAYESNGEKILDETISAQSDSEAKEQGEARLAELNMQEKSHRLTSPKGQLLLFHR